jgi:DNA-binding PadR family transcriptional regulator
MSWSRSRPWWGTAFAWAPFGQSARFFESGEVRLAILSLLSEGPKNGYQLIKQMQERSGGLYRASAGTVYPTLQQLEDEGLIEMELRKGKRLYKLTAAGRKELGSDPETVRKIWERAEQWEGWGQCFRPEAFAILGPATEVMKSSMRAAARAAGQPEREQKVRSILERARKELEALGD